jgi:hypothetical protein
MKKLVPILVAMAVGLTGCQTQTHPTAAVQPLSKDARLVGIYNRLKTEPIPTPQVTSFDKDARLRHCFLAGFTNGWDFAISGKILYGTQVAPAGMPPDCFSAWQAGARDGARLGGDSLLAKLEEGK